MIVHKAEDYLNACSSGDINTVKEHFEYLNTTEIESIRDNHKATCLHYAARVGSLDIIQYLIVNKKVSPFVVSEIGATILHDAAVKGKIQVIEWLVKNTELNLGVKDTNGATLVHIASKFDQVELIDWIVEYEGVKSIREQMYNGATCLHFACATNSVKSLKKILKAAPNLINIQMMNGVTPLYLATQENNISVVRFLTRHGANVKLKAADGMTPFHVACQNGSLDMVNFILDEFKVNVNEKDFSGVTSLHFACISGNEKIVSLLLTNGAKIVPDKNGTTPLHDCAAGGHIECARLLVANNCDVSIRDNHGMSALDIARTYGYMKFYDEFKKFAKSITDESGIIRLDINENNKRNLEKVTVMVNANENKTSKSRDLSTKENTIISPIFNSNAVVSTSTPSLIEQSIQNVPNETPETISKSYTMLSRQLSVNQGYVKIISTSDKIAKAIANSTTPNSIIDKSISEHDKLKSNQPVVGADKKPAALNETQIVSNDSASKSSSNYHQSSLPSRPQKDLFTGAVPPPPPPPLPSTWSFKSSAKSSFNRDIELNAVKLKSVSDEKKQKPLSSSANFIDELQNQFRNGSIFKKTIDSSEIKSTTILLDSNNNLDSINENRKSFHPSSANVVVDDDDDENNLKDTLKHQVSELRLLNSNYTSKSRLDDMPEWKRKLIEKKKQKLSQQNLAI